jgi:hypothetical protein
MAGDVGILYQKDLYQNINMKLKLGLITLTCLFILSAGRIKAQTTEPTFTQGQLKAAERCLIATGIDKPFGDLIDKTIITGSTQIPEEHRASFVKVMKTFMGKYFTWDVLKGSIAKLYAAEFTESELDRLAAFYSTPLGKKVVEDALKSPVTKLDAAHFTESELKQLTAFYNTPLGKKISEKLPGLMQKGMLLGQQAVEDHRPELEQMMKDAFQADAAPTQKNN